ncbi:MAG TPA: tetratricopeptide repeat protein, partial [Myxococcota bacterium]
MSHSWSDAAPRGRGLLRGLATAACAGLVLLACSPRDPAAEARALLEEGRRAEAIALLRAEIEARPADPHLYHLYGSALLADRQPSLATWPLRRAAQDPELAVEAGLLLAQALLAGGGEYDAVRAADEVLALEPNHVGALKLRVQARLRSLDEEGALEDIARLTALGYGGDPRDPSLLQAKLEAELKLERVEEARETIASLHARAAEAGEEFPEEYAARLCALEAVFTAEAGDAAAAEVRHDACAAEHPTAHVVLEEAIRFFDAQGRFERGAEMLERAVAEAPDDRALRMQLAARLRDLGRADEAERLLREAAERLGTPLDWTALADHFVALEDLAGAASALGRAVEVQTGRPLGVGGYAGVPDDGLFAYADLLVQLGEHDRVRQMLPDLEEPAYVRFLEGRMRLERGDFAGADEAYRQGLRLWPSNPGARYLAGQAAEQLGDFDRAISHYREALRADPSRTPAGLALARIQLAEGNRGAARDALAYHLRGHPRDAKALRRYAALASELDRAAEASALRAQLAKLPGQAGAAVADHARDVLRAEGSEAAARSIEQTQIDLSDPAHAEALRAWSEIASLRGRDAEALSRIDAALALHPDAAALHAARGGALQRAGREEEAVAALERALELDGAYVPALVALAERAAARGDVEAALGLYDAATAADPEEVAPARDAALLVLARGDVVAARARFAAVLRSHPWYGDAAYQLALLDLERGEIDDRALDHAQRAARFRYGAPALELLGRLLLARGEKGEAVAVLERAVKIEGSGPAVQFHLGRALEAIGDLQGARAAYR